MDDRIEPPPHFPLVAAAFEGGLVVAALAAGWALGQPPLETFHWEWSAAAWGCAAALGPLALLWLCLRSRWRPVERLVEVVDRLILPLFESCGPRELAIIAFLAGLGEEMLFRGVIQAAAADWVGGDAGVAAGLLVAAFLFGLAHLITPAYGLFATLIGLYFGLLWLWTGNLLAPITAHAVYDFLALLYLGRRHRARRPQAPSGDSDAGTNL